MLEKVVKKALNSRVGRLGLAGFAMFSIGCGGNKPTKSGDEPIDIKIENPVISFEGSSGDVDVFNGVVNEVGEVAFMDEKSEDGEARLVLTDGEGRRVGRGINVDYFDGDEYKVFLLEDPERRFLPSMGVFTHNSVHDISVRETKNGIARVQLIDDDETLQAFYTWQHDFTGSRRKYRYVKTISNDERLDLKERNPFVLSVAEAAFKSDPMVALDDGLILLGRMYDIKSIRLISMAPNFSQGIPWRDILNLIYPEPENPVERWDSYEYETGDRNWDESVRWNGNMHAFVPSNVPLVRFVEVNGRRIEWEGIDKKEYDQPFFYSRGDREKDPIDDLTVLLGRTIEPDLDYYIKIRRDGEQVHFDATRNNWLDVDLETVTLEIVAPPAV